MVEGCPGHCGMFSSSPVPLPLDSVAPFPTVVIINTFSAAVAAAKSLQSCPTLCNPMDCSLPGFSVPGILQARTLEWVAISFSNAWKWKVKVKSLSRVWLLATPWTTAYQFLPSMGFSGQQYWSGVPLPSPNTFSRHCQMPSTGQNRPWLRITALGECTSIVIGSMLLIK